MALHTISPTVDHVRTIESLLIFDAMHPVHVISVPHADGAELLDVHLSIHGERAPYFTLAGVPFFLPADVHLYYAPSDRPIAQAIDLTAPMKNAIRQALRALDPAVFQEAYRTALDTLLRFESAPGLDLSVNPQILAADRARINALATTPASELFDQMGNRGVGLGGSLHVFNWLYTYIPLPPISLATLLSAVQSPPFDLSLQAQRRPRLIVSHGPMERVGRPDPAPSGSVRLALEAVFHNPLEDELDELERKIRVELLEIQKKFRIGSPLMKAVANIDDSSLHIETDIRALTSLIASTRAEIIAVLSEARQIAQRLSVLELPIPTVPGLPR